jgi:nicotinate phosphoribosyltransferase
MLPSTLGLFTDLYELTMAQAYLAEGMDDRAVFSLFVRRLPPDRNYLIACGLDAVLSEIERLGFTADDLDYVRSLDRFSDRLLDWLREFRFTGDVDAVPEGTPVFANEPILEIAGPMPQAQVLETLVMNQVQLQTVLATKAARVVTAARGRTVIDFGSRRAHGLDAALAGARAFHVAGVQGTSNVLAGKLFGLPVAGTMAHSYIQAHDDEGEAFRAFATEFPGTVILVDTYDTLDGVRKVIDLVTHGDGRVRVGGVRLDSGDLLALARETRQLLDGAGLRDVQIFASSDLDEHRVAELLDAGAPIDGFGVGTAMSVSTDAPALDIVYKLCEYAGEGRTKLASRKPVLPGAKQVFRRETSGVAAEDVIAAADETLDGRALLRPVMRGGRRVPLADGDLASARGRAADEIARLPAHIRALAPATPPFPVHTSARLTQRFEEVRARMRRRSS